jgi:hypothetical protein
MNVLNEKNISGTHKNSLENKWSSHPEIAQKTLQLSPENAQGTCR